MKKQFVFLNGGVPRENYSSYEEYLQGIKYNPEKEAFQNWNKLLPERLGDNWEFLRAPFPTRKFADYAEWKLIFEKMIPFFNPEGIYLWATSLWATFLFKYLGESELQIRIKKLFLIAPAMSDTKNEILWSFSFDFDLNYHRVQRAADQIYIYHSTDDTVVPFQQSLELKTYFPDAIFREFHDRGHFYRESNLPEIEQDLQN